MKEVAQNTDLLGSSRRRGEGVRRGRSKAETLRHAQLNIWLRKPMNLVQSA
jgi:hypothetical protein